MYIAHLLSRSFLCQVFWILTFEKNLTSRVVSLKVLRLLKLDEGTWLFMLIEEMSK